ncbi:MAG: DNA polymerase III subunit delta [Rhodobacteraceae bacterium]|nr:DNA polymerase III subunit delta [Paracoccaceae bacterium]
MKLTARQAPGYFRSPDVESAGILIYGADAMRIALRRAEVVAALIGPQGADEMRLTRMAAGDLRRDPALLLDAIKAIGFFPGLRVALVEDANDTVAPAVAAAMHEWRPGDAQVVVTAGALRATSALRKLFEGHRSAYAVGLYDDPPDRAEIERMLADGGLRQIPGDTMAALQDLAATIGPGDFRQTVEKTVLYKRGDDTPLSLADVAACAPATSEAALDDMMDIVAEGRLGEIGPMIARLQAQGTNAVSLCIAAMRHFRTLHAAASDPGGASTGLARARPPVFGPRRDRLARQVQIWGALRLEQAIQVLLDTDLRLRAAGQRPPEMALVERAMIRLAMLGRRG